jgi:hypothetical protein
LKPNDWKPPNIIKILSNSDKKPIPIKINDIQDLIKKLLSNLIILCNTCYYMDDTIKIIIESIGLDPSIQPEYKNDIEIVADQADAMIDIWYYTLNAAAKNGIDISKVLEDKQNENKIIDIME